MQSIRVVQDMSTLILEEFMEVDICIGGGFGEFLRVLLSQFDDNVQEFRNLNVIAVADVLDRNPTKWCRAFLSCHSSCDSVDNNM